MKFLYFLPLLFLLTFSANAQNDPTYWWNDAVFYEIFVRSFYDSDGDGIGDFKGLTSQLDYLNDGDPTTTDDLGITGIWLMPISPSPSYHGYDVTDYYGIESDYGTVQDFKDFMAAAHARGIKVIVDLVLNHSSSQHPWFQQARQGHGFYENFYRFTNNLPSYSGPWGQPVWHSNSTNTNHYYGVFWSGMPDLNYGFQPVIDSLYEVTEFWLDDMGVDGFRCDAVKFIYENGTQLENTPQTYTFWENWNQHYKSINPNAMAVGEAWDSRNVVVNYTGNKFDFCFEFDLAGSMLATANSGNANSLRVTTYNTYNDYPFLQFGTFLTNHDMNRVIEVLGQDRNKARIAASLYLTLPGVPYVYYGEEIGMRGEKPDQNIRRPMQWSDANFGGFSTGGNWTALNSNYTSVNVASQTNDPTSLLHHYRELIHIRNQEVTLRRGTYHDCYTPRLQVMSFVRQLDKEAVLVLVNLQGVAAPAFSIDVASTDLAIADHVVQNLMDGTFTTLQVGMDQRIDDLELAPWETRIYKIQDVTGAGEIANPSALSVFPNPFTGTVQLKGLPAGQAFHFELSDLHGRMLQHGNQQIATAATVLEFPELSPGVYLLTVHTNNQQHTLKVIHR